MESPSFYEQKEERLMKKALMLLLILWMLPLCAFGERMSMEEVNLSVQKDYPGWDVVYGSFYGSGTWQGEMATHLDFRLLRIEGNFLHLLDMNALWNPLQPGDIIPWEETAYAPLALTAEGAAFLSFVPAKEIWEGRKMEDRLLPYCDVGFFTLPGEDGITLLTLCLFPRHQVAVVENEQGENALRIAAWNNGQWESMQSSPWQKERFYVNALHSGDDFLECYVEDGEILLYPNKEGTWQLSSINNGMEILYIGQDYIADVAYGEDKCNNDIRIYGKPQVETELLSLYLNKLPTTMKRMKHSLDTENFACVKESGTPMYAAPGGEAMATLYARAVGQVADEKEGYVCLQIGTEKQGLSGWFRKEDLAFGDAVNRVICDFPSYDRDLFADAKTLGEVIPGVESKENPYAADVWLIGTLPDGSWLVEVNGEEVVRAEKDIFFGISPAEHDE